MQGFGGKVIAYDIRENPAVTALGIPYVSKEEVLEEADIISLHVPLLPSTYHIIDRNRCLRTLKIMLPKVGCQIMLPKLVLSNPVPSLGFVKSCCLNWYCQILFLQLVLSNYVASLLQCRGPHVKLTHTLFNPVA